MLRRCVTCLTLSLVGALACAAVMPPAARAADIYPGEAYPDRYGRYERYERYEPYPRETYGGPALRPPAPVPSLQLVNCGREGHLQPIGLG